MLMPEFISFPKVARLSRECIITEKIDGTNAQIFIDEQGQMWTGSRTRWITPEQDNYGFAKWARQHEEELLTLGPGHHFGEWWGLGIQRGYGLKEKRLSLFNVSRWCLAGEKPRVEEFRDILPPCCGLVPVLYQGLFTTEACITALRGLEIDGSVAAPGFSKPEGIVCYHTAGKVCFKKTIEQDDSPEPAQ